MFVDETWVCATTSILQPEYCYTLMGRPTICLLSQNAHAINPGNLCCDKSGSKLSQIEKSGQPRSHNLPIVFPPSKM
jgi:hypothetical protein